MIENVALETSGLAVSEVYPAWNLNGPLIERVVEHSRKLALALDTRGLINIQYVIYENEIYVIEVNPSYNFV